MMNFGIILKTDMMKKFANFICNDLNIITPSVLTVLTLKELNDAAKAVYPNLKSPSIEYYSCDPKDKNATHELQQTIMALIKILKNELTEKNRKKRKLDGLTTTTSSEVTDGEVHVEKDQVNSLNDKLIGKRKHRNKKAKSSNGSSSRNEEWSYSSDEYKPPLLEQLFPSKSVSVKERADFELATNGRIDYFCQKYLCLSDVMEISKFQHYAQIEMGMHKEHIYEYFHFIRSNQDLLDQIQELSKKLQK